jgi:hypothetical protein
VINAWRSAIGAVLAIAVSGCTSADRESSVATSDTLVEARQSPASGTVATGSVESSVDAVTADSMAKSSPAADRGCVDEAGTLNADAPDWYPAGGGSALVLNGEPSTGVGLDEFEQAAADAVGQVVPGFALDSGAEYESHPGGCVTHRYAKLTRDDDEIIVSTWRVESAADPHWVPNESPFDGLDSSTLVSNGEHIGVVLAVAADGTTARVTVYGAGASERVAGWPTTIAPLPNAPELGAAALTANALIPVARAVLTFVLSQR